MKHQVNIGNLKDATAQQVFDTVFERMEQQEFQRSVSKHGGCYYRNGEGLCCAAGALFTDEQYETIKPDTLNENTWRDLVTRDLVNSTHTDLIECLQNAHDDLPLAYVGPEILKRRLNEVANSFGLKERT